MDANVHYAGFWRRLYAGMVDVLVLSPVTIFAFWAQQTRPMAVATLIPLALISTLYTLLLHARFGQTIGKMAAKIRVFTVDGQPIGGREALLRQSVDIGLSILTTGGHLVALMAVTDAAYDQALAYGFFSPEWGEFAKELQAMSPTPQWVTWVAVAWFWSEMLVILFNKKKRALHDFIAGTVVTHVMRDAAGQLVPKTR